MILSSFKCWFAALSTYSSPPWSMIFADQIISEPLSLVTRENSKITQQNTSRPMGAIWRMNIDTP